jgi:hypothetical protein
MPPSALPSAQGTTFTFAGTTFKVRKVSRKRSTQEIEVSTLDLAEGSDAVYEPAPLNDGDVITVEGYDMPNPGQDASGAITCAKFGISGYAICTEYEISGEVKGKIQFTAAFRMTTVVPPSP